MTAADQPVGDAACTCANDGDAHRCPLHSQADYDAQQAGDAERGRRAWHAVNAQGPYARDFPSNEYFARVGAFLAQPAPEIHVGTRVSWVDDDMQERTNTVVALDGLYVEVDHRDPDERHGIPTTTLHRDEVTVVEPTPLDEPREALVKEILDAWDFVHGAREEEPTRPNPPVYADGGWLPPGGRVIGDGLVAVCVLDGMSDVEAYATAWNDGWTNAHAQQHVDDPADADDWLEEHDERVRRAALAKVAVLGQERCERLTSGSCREEPNRSPRAFYADERYCLTCRIAAALDGEDVTIEDRPDS